MLGVMCHSTPRPETYGFVHNNGIYTTLDGPGSASITTIGANDSGEVVGAYSNLVEGCSTEVACENFVYVDGMYTTLEFPVSTKTIASGVKSSGSHSNRWATSTRHDADIVVRLVFVSVAEPYGGRPCRSRPRRSDPRGSASRSPGRASPASDRVDDLVEPGLKEIALPAVPPLPGPHRITLRQADGETESRPNAPVNLQEIKPTDAAFLQTP